ncbi:MAG: hypothetical protein Terrestrivirus5_99 [Terrestrivirus sp.]|uniref:Uncharacterized protein n=1 Tax=Terrestrivirus sp. TaxID=2487775 RepID=A0A3G4ZN35_9VIRU|nr:MAG: hypothetical protein Terrestrivirus5_99 [Terrestrivirus sp.]
METAEPQQIKLSIRLNDCFSVCFRLCIYLIIFFIIFVVPLSFLISASVITALLNNYGPVCDIKIDTQCIQIDNSMLNVTIPSNIIIMPNQLVIDNIYLLNYNTNVTNNTGEFDCEWLPCQTIDITSYINTSEDNDDGAYIDCQTNYVFGLNPIYINYCDNRYWTFVTSKLVLWIGFTISFGISAVILIIHYCSDDDDDDD